MRTPSVGSRNAGLVVEVDFVDSTAEVIVGAHGLFDSVAATKGHCICNAWDDEHQTLGLLEASGVCPEERTKNGDLAEAGETRAGAVFGASNEARKDDGLAELKVHKRVDVCEGSAWDAGAAVAGKVRNAGCDAKLDATCVSVVARLASDVGTELDSHKLSSKRVLGDDVPLAARAEGRLRVVGGDECALSVEPRPTVVLRDVDTWKERSLSLIHI